MGVFSRRWACLSAFVNDGSLPRERRVSARVRAHVAALAHLAARSYVLAIRRVALDQLRAFRCFRGDRTMAKPAGLEQFAEESLSLRIYRQGSSKVAEGPSGVEAACARL